MNADRFDNVLYAVCQRLRSVLASISSEEKSQIEEIRLRAGKPLVLTVSGRPAFLSKNGQILFEAYSDSLIVGRADIFDSFRLLCDNSVYAHEKELQNGFVMMKNGGRAGICGRLTASGVQDITSINIRISREIYGAADSLLKAYKQKGLLICGPPLSGKTTVLRDLIRQLSNRLVSVCVIDSRGELSGIQGDFYQNDLGLCTDVLITPDKALGCEIALRTMNPDIIAFDEIGTDAELLGVEQGFYSGVSVITTAHISDIKELNNRKITARLLKSGAIEQIALLPEKHKGEIRIFSTEELFKNAIV